MLIAQITDTHVADFHSAVEQCCRTADHLERAVTHLNALRPRPDLVLHTGDVVDHGRLDEYQRARATLDALAMPFYVIPGNHDDRETMVRAFDDHGYLPRDGGYLQYTIDDFPVRLIALDTLVPGSNTGLLCADRLAWLEARLAESPERPTVIFMHHPPFRTALAAMDKMGLDGSDRLAAVVTRHPQIEAILCGHVHRPIVRRFAGTIACICPATAHQVALDLPPEQRLAIVMEPPAAMLHLWLGREGGLVTHLSYIDEQPTFTVYDGEQWLHGIKPPDGFLRR
jgi:3',5'-cyclic AMP phosphodiesterase CpdA